MQIIRRIDELGALIRVEHPAFIFRTQDQHCSADADADAPHRQQIDRTSVNYPVAGENNPVLW